MNLRRKSERALLELHAEIINELKRRRVVRTRNNPIGDYAEWLVSRALNLTLAGNSAAGYDATDAKGQRYQIKARRTSPKNSSCQLSAIRNLSSREFDFLAAVVFDSRYKVLDAIVIPHKLVKKFSTYREHVNAHILHVSGELVTAKGVKDFKSRLQ